MAAKVYALDAINPPCSQIRDKRQGRLGCASARDFWGGQPRLNLPGGWLADEKPADIADVN